LLFCTQSYPHDEEAIGSELAHTQPNNITEHESGIVQEPQSSDELDDGGTSNSIAPVESDSDSDVTESQSIDEVYTKQYKKDGQRIDLKEERKSSITHEKKSGGAEVRRHSRWEERTITIGPKRHSNDDPNLAIEYSTRRSSKDANSRRSSKDDALEKFPSRKSSLKRDVHITRDETPTKEIGLSEENSADDDSNTRNSSDGVWDEKRTIPSRNGNEIPDTIERGESSIASSKLKDSITKKSDSLLEQKVPSLSGGELIKPTIISPHDENAPLVEDKKNIGEQTSKLSCTPARSSVTKVGTGVKKDVSGETGKMKKDKINKTQTKPVESPKQSKSPTETQTNDEKSQNDEKPLQRKEQCTTLDSPVAVSEVTSEKNNPALNDARNTTPKTIITPLELVVERNADNIPYETKSSTKDHVMPSDKVMTRLDKLDNTMLGKICDSTVDNDDATPKKNQIETESGGINNEGKTKPSVKAPIKKKVKPKVVAEMMKTNDVNPKEDTPGDKKLSLNGQPIRQRKLGATDKIVIVEPEDTIIPKIEVSGERDHSLCAYHFIM